MDLKIGLLSKPRTSPCADWSIARVAFFHEIRSYNKHDCLSLQRPRELPMD